MTTTQRTIEASPADIPFLIAKIEKVNRKVVKNGLTPYIWTVSPVRTVKRTTAYGEVTAEVVDLTLIGETPVINGWEFVATLDWDPEVGVVTRVPEGVEVDLSWVRVEGVNAWCDHCSTARRRNDTFVLRSTETGEMKQIGRNCLAAYIGLSVSLWLPEDNAFDNAEEGGWLGRCEWRSATQDVLAIALAIADKQGGYVSKAQAEASRQGW